MLISDNKPYLYINGSYFALSDLDTVLEEEYYKEYLKKNVTTTDTGTTT
jgi:hypothetical protein